MRFAIVGAGALGTILAAHLMRAGHDVTVIARGVRAGAVRQNGLCVRGLAVFDVACTPITRPESVRETEVLIYAVKTYHMAAALGSTRHIAAACVFSVANGAMKNEQLRDAFPEAQVCGCMADFSGELLDSGAVEFTRNICLHLGPRRSSMKCSTDAVAAAITDAGINARAIDHINSVEWSKFVGWVAMFSLSIIARTTTGRYLADPALARLGVHLVREVAAVADKLGITLVDESPLPVATLATAPFDRAVEKLMQVGQALTAAAPGHRVSGLQDLESGRALEFEETLGYAVRLAEQHGLEAPALRTCYDIAAGLDGLNRTSI